MSGLAPTPAESRRLDGVPLAWSVMRLKHVARLQYGDSLPANARVPGPFAVYGSNGVVGRHGQANTRGPAVIVGRKGSFGKVQYCPEACFCIDTAYYVDRLSTRAELRWLAWLLEGLALDTISQDTGVPSLSRDLAHAMRVPVPPLDEQRAIADALDRRCGAVDALIAKRRQRLELLAEMRSSMLIATICGHDVPGPRRESRERWIDTVPRGWPVERLKRLALMTTGHTPTRGNPALWRDCEIPWVSLADTRTLARHDVIERTEVRISRAGLAASACRVLPAGTVVCTRDATIGLAAILGCPMALSQHLVGWICGPLLDPSWLLYALYAMRPELNRLRMGATIDTLGLPVLRQLAIPLPSRETQARIVAELRPRLARLDRLEANTQAQIERLEALRRSLVFSVVHGRLRVR